MHQRPKSLPSSLLAALQKAPARYAAGQADGAATTVASYNVHKCIGMDKKFDPHRVAAVIGEIDADIVALQEADERFGRRAGLLDLHSLERQTDLIPVPVPLNARGHGWHGNVLLVRESVVRGIRQHKLPGVEPRGALVVDLDLKGVPLRIIAAHLGLLRHSRSLQATTLLDIALAERRPTILLGDLNEWRLGRRSSLRPLGPDFGPIHAAIPSFPSRYPLLALDRILASPQDLISSIEAHDTPLARIASDHLPMKARIDLRPALQDAPHEYT
jgi:endonuclease/exonuclease/phosphatase family metal-dependent hydrolase